MSFVLCRLPVDAAAGLVFLRLTPKLLGGTNNKPSIMKPLSETKIASIHALDKLNHNQTKLNQHGFGMF